MKFEIILSLALHLGIVAVSTFGANWYTRKTPDLGEVIRVSLSALPPQITAEPEVVPVPDVPDAVTEQLPDIPVSDPAVMPKAKVPDKPKAKPKKKPVKNKSQTAASTESQSTTEVDAPGAGEGSPFSGMTIDNSSFDYPYWFTQALYKIRSNWRNTVSADGPIVCTIYFQVIKSGRVIEARIKEPSGIAAFDRACLTAVQRSAPFPPLPREFVDEIIGITLPFQYRP